MSYQTLAFVLLAVLTVGAGGVNLGAIDVKWKPLADRHLMYRESPDGQKTFKAGETITITCTSNTSQIQWTYPATVNSSHPGVTITEGIHETEYDNGYISTLTVADAAHYHAGTYACHCQGRTAPHMTGLGNSNSHIKRLQVYVEDSRSLFSNTKPPMGAPIAAMGMMGAISTFDCQPAQEGVSLQLVRFMGMGLPVDGVVYVPGVGMEMRMESVTAAGMYSCVAEKDGVRESRLYILIAFPSDPSKMGTPKISAKGKKYEITRGRTLRLRCMVVAFAGMPLSLTWYKDDVELVNSTDVRVGPATIVGLCARGSTLCKYARADDNVSTRRIIARLRVRNVSEEDAGQYKCSGSTYGMTKSRVKTVTVVERRKGKKNNGNKKELVEVDDEPYGAADFLW